MSENEVANSDQVPSFSDLALSSAVSRALADLEYDKPTPVQAEAFEPASAGRDLVVQARTGTGKTTAFGLPLVNGRVRAELDAVQALVLTPTRELALQVNAEIEALAKYTDINVVSVYGGAAMGKQIEELSTGAHIVVGTPGRVLDHLGRGTLKLDKLRTFVLDECDEMLSMGFLPQITEVWNQLPAVHQTLLFSATIPRQVERIADTRLRAPEFITLSGDHIGALEIQHFVYLSHGNKLKELLQVIEVEDPESAIVFCNTRDETKRVCRALQEAGFKADWLNADLNQNEREKVMKALRGNELRFLVCTDVAARGIDISHLTHVINYDFPGASEQYVHRTGRTGRAGKTGMALTLVEPGSIGDLYYLRLKYNIHPIERHLPTPAEMETRQEADIVAELELRFAPRPPSDPRVSLARRLMTHDHAESIIAGLLAQHLGDAKESAERATLARRQRHRRAAPEGERTGEGAPRRRVQRGSESQASANASEQEGPKPRRRHRDEGNADERTRPQTSRRRRHEELGISYEVSDMDPEVSPVVGPDAKPDANPTPEMHDSDVARGALDSRERVTHVPEPEAAEYVSLYVGVGKRDGAKVENIQKALANVGVGAEATGKIAIKQRHSFVEIRPERQDAAIEQLNGTTICGREAVVELARPRVEA